MSNHDQFLGGNVLRERLLHFYLLKLHFQVQNIFPKKENLHIF